MGPNPSYVWRSIHESYAVICQGCRRKIGDGLNTKVFNVPWLPCPINGFMSSLITVELENITAYSLMDIDMGGWDDDVLNDIFNERDQNLIREIPLSRRRRNDSWIWLFDNKGEFTVRSCYRQLRGENACLDGEYWRIFWQLRLPGKVLNLLWRACQNVLPTAKALARN